MNLSFLHRAARTIKERWIMPLRKIRARKALFQWAKACLPPHELPCQAQELGGGKSRLTLRISCEETSFIAQYSKHDASFQHFLRLGMHLHSQGVRVPRILQYDVKRRFMLLEDLGTVTVGSLVFESWSASGTGPGPDADRTGQDRTGDAARDLLGQSLRALVAFHDRGTQNLAPEWNIPLVDVEHWTAYSLRHLAFVLREHCPLVSPERFTEAREELRRYRTSVALEKSSRRLCHLDCHLGNFLLKDGVVYLLDWELAQLAPPALELARYFMYPTYHFSEFLRYRDTGLAVYLEASDLSAEERTLFMRQEEFFELGFLLRRFSQRLRYEPIWSERISSVLERESLTFYPALADILRALQFVLHAEGKPEQRSPNGKISVSPATPLPKTGHTCAQCRCWRKSG